MRSGNRHVILMMMMTMVWPCLTLWLISDDIISAAVASPVLLRSAREHAGGVGGGAAAMSVEMESARTPHRRGDLEEVEALLRPIRIVAIGDSITSCSGVRPSFDFAYLSYRQALYYRLLLHAAQQTEVRERRARHATTITATAGGNHHNKGTDDAAAVELIDDDDRGDTPSIAETRRGRRKTRRKRSAAEDGGWVRIGRCRLSFVGPRHGCNRKLNENGFPPPFPSSPPSLLWDRLVENHTHHSTTTPLPSSSLLLYAFPDHHDAYFGRRAADLLQELARWGEEKKKNQSPSTSEKQHRQESVLRQFYHMKSRHDDTVPQSHQTPVDVVLLWIGINDLLLDAISGDDAAQRVAAVLEQLQRRFPDALYFVGTPLLIDPKRAKIKRSRREALLNSIHQLQDRLEEMFGGPPIAHDPQQQSRFSRDVQDDEVGRTTTTTTTLATGARTALESNDGNNNNKNNNTTSSSKTKKVTLVRFPSFHPSVHTYDGLHPNHEGEWRIAASWYEALQSQLFDRDAFGCRRRRRRASSSSSIRIRSGSVPIDLLAPPFSSSGMVPPARFESTDDSPPLDVKQSSREAAHSATTMDETKSAAAAAAAVDVDPLEALLPQLLFASMLVFVVCGPRVWRCIYRRRVAV